MTQPNREDDQFGGPDKDEHSTDKRQTDDISAERASDTTPAQAAETVAARVEEEQEEKPKPPPTAAVVYNPVKVDLDVLKAAIASAESAAGWRESVWLETSEDDPGQGMAQQALEQGCDLVLAAGGDGTIRAVAEILAGTDVPMALLPSGTGNLLARNLELTLDNLEESVTTAFTGANRPVDVAVAELRREDGSQEKHTFVVMAGLGLDAQMMVNTDDDLKKKVGWLAYVQALSKAVKGGNRIAMRWQADDRHRHTSHVHTMLIGNCGSLPGNVLLLPDAAVDDGTLDIALLRPGGALGWIQVWSKILFENGILRRHEVGRKLTNGLDREIRALRYLTARSIDVGLKEPEEFEIDGDPVGQVTAFRVHIEPEALLVKVPGDEIDDEPNR